MLKLLNILDQSTSNTFWRSQIYVCTMCKEWCRSLHNKKQNTQKSVASTGNRTSDQGPRFESPSRRPIFVCSVSIHFEDVCKIFNVACYSTSKWDLPKESPWRHSGKRRKYWSQEFSAILHVHSCNKVTDIIDLRSEGAVWSWSHWLQFQFNTAASRLYDLPGYCKVLVLTKQKQLKYYCGMSILIIIESFLLSVFLLQHLSYVMVCVQLYLCILYIVLSKTFSLIYFWYCG